MSVATTPSAGADPAQDDTPGSGYCRVTIAAPTTRVDLALPTSVPVIDLLPGVVAFAEEDVAAPHSWALARLDGTAIDIALSLSRAGVREGELLVLRPARDLAGPPLYDDVVEVLGEGVEPTAWGGRDTRLAGSALGALAVGAALWAGAAVGGVLAGVLIGVLALLLLGGGAALAHSVDDLQAATVLAVLSAAAGVTSGAVLLGPPVGAAHLLLAAGVMVLVAAVAPPLLGGGDSVFVTLAVAGVLAGVAALIVLLVPTSAARGAAVVAPLALALTTAMPAVALRLSRIPRPPLPRTAAELVEVPGQVDLDQVQHRVARARSLLSGLLIGCYAVTGAGIVVLTRDLTTPWPCVLAAILTVLLLLRARLFRRRGQVAAPLATAGVGIVAGGAAATVAWAQDTAVLLGGVAPAALVVAAIAAAFGLGGSRGQLNPRLARTIDLAETLLLLAVVPIVLAVWDVYNALLELRA